MSTPLVKVDRVGKIFHDSSQHTTNAIKEVTLDINEGDFLTIFGPNGSGKSTLAMQISLEFAENNRVLFFDSENSFSIERIKLMSNEYEKLLENILVIKIKDFEDQSLDFVYIDAGHDFMNFTQDLHWWLKKIKIGGIMSGHDYARYPFHKYIHVKRVLEAYAWSYKMIPFFIVGAEEYKDGTVRDRYRSWMWVKDKHFD